MPDEMGAHDWIVDYDVYSQGHVDMKKRIRIPRRRVCDSRGVRDGSVSQHSTLKELWHFDGTVLPHDCSMGGARCRGMRALVHG